MFIFCRTIAHSMHSVILVARFLPTPGLWPSSGNDREPHFSDGSACTNELVRKCKDRTCMNTNIKTILIFPNIMVLGMLCCLTRIGTLCYLLLTSFLRQKPITSTYPGVHTRGSHAHYSTNTFVYPAVVLFVLLSSDQAWNDSTKSSVLGYINGQYFIAVLAVCVLLAACCRKNSEKLKTLSRGNTLLLFFRFFYAAAVAA